MFTLPQLRSLRNKFALDNTRLRAEMSMLTPAHKESNQRFIDRNIVEIHNVTEEMRGLVFAPHAN